MNKPTLYIFSGLPGSGKSTLAQELARRTNAVFVRIDTVEQGLKDICKMEQVEGEGYRLSYRICKDNLLCGNNVIADSVNPIKLCRDEWQEVATSVGSSYINIEVICSDKDEHRARLEQRDNGIENLENPTWEKVLNREYDEWTTSVLRIDTAGREIEDCVQNLIREIKPFNDSH
jgi:predicted kinase